MNGSKRWNELVGTYLTMGAQLALPPVILFFLGQWLDERYGTGLWLRLAGLAIGITGGFIKFVRTATALGEQADTEAKGQQERKEGED
jgi:F0F1-type ATP synthase assembly protein I